MTFNVSVCRAGGQHASPISLTGRAQSKTPKHSLVSLFSRFNPEDEIIADSRPLFSPRVSVSLIRIKAERSCAFCISHVGTGGIDSAGPLESMRIISAGMFVDVWRRISHKSASSADLGSLASRASPGRRLSLAFRDGLDKARLSAAFVDCKFTRFPDQEQQRRRSASSTPAVSQIKQPRVGLLDHGAELLWGRSEILIRSPAPDQLTRSMM